MSDEEADRAARRKRLQFTCKSHDVDAQRCRLWLNGLNERANKEELIELFTTHGRVYDLSVINNFGFIQYDNMQSSLSAIQALNQTIYNGNKITVKLADKGGGGPGPATPVTNQTTQSGNQTICKYFQWGGCSRGAQCFFKHVKAESAEASNGMTNRDRQSGGSSNRAPQYTDSRGRDHSRDSRGGGGGLPPPDRSHHRSSDRDRTDERSLPPSDRRSGGLLPHNDRGGSKRPLPDDFDDHSRRSRPEDRDRGRSDMASSGPPSYSSYPQSRAVGAPPGRPGPPGQPVPGADARRPANLNPPSRNTSTIQSSTNKAPAVAAPAPRREAAPPVDLRPPYDCVIIAGAEAQRTYSDVIEKRLLDFGMLTNVQVVDGEHLLKRAVEEAARHTVPYTICVTANNEQHRSLTLNILHGVAQEHRNMPLDDAMPFLSRNFDNFVELMKQKISQANEWLTPDSKVAFYLNLLAEGRRVTLPEIIEVDKYVQAVIGKLRPAAERPAARPPVASVSREVIGEPRYPPESRGLLGMGQRAAPTQPRQEYSSGGTMSDLLRSRGLERGDERNGGVYNKPTTVPANINFNDPSIKRALDGLLGARPNLPEANNTRPSGYY